MNNSSLPTNNVSVQVSSKSVQCKFHQNLFTGSEDKSLEMKFDTLKKVALKIKSR